AHLQRHARRADRPAARVEAGARGEGDPRRLRRLARRSRSRCNPCRSRTVARLDGGGRMNHAGVGPWARLLATAVVRDEGSTVAERARALVREGEVGPVKVEQGTLAAEVAGYSAAITAKPV